MTHPSWKKHIPLIQSGYARDVLLKTRALRKTRTIFPEDGKVFYALDILPFDHVRVVILGQDPYHGEGQAHGLAFSVPQGITAPPSLKNIFKEITADCACPETRSTDLSDWAEQGVLLLNASLTVEKGKPGSHKTLGWHLLTDQIISELSVKRKNLVFMLWGAHAQSKKNLIQPDNHLVLTAPHPSPLSAYRGFLGCRHFSKANGYLKTHGVSPVIWA
ncbi:MAG: uracil-DNA glycosylase [Proteobacteria bacterium]|nr:uracil-DNA glycosylase [Pseudomonadota bacterium]